MLPLILASTSPRRSDLMTQVGLEFTVQAPDADETPRRGESPRAMVRRLALEKARSLEGWALERHEHALIVAADTIVVAPDGRRIFGKPRDTGEARRMLKALAGRTHTVFTGYAILRARAQSGAGGRSAPRTRNLLARVVASKVKMRALTRSEIDAYIATGEPMDKAGAYAAQGVGMALIESLRGSYTNVVGLPMAQLLADLEHGFGVPLFGGGRRS